MKDEILMAIFKAETETELLAIDMAVTMALEDRVIDRTVATVLWNQIEQVADAILRDLI